MDLDSLLEDLGPSGPQKPTVPPKVSKDNNAAKPPNSSSQGADLDSLMESLDATGVPAPKPKPVAARPTRPPKPKPKSDEGGKSGVVRESSDLESLLSDLNTTHPTPTPTHTTTTAAVSNIDNTKTEDKQPLGNCADCGKPILEKCISTLGKKFHWDHFRCFVCGITLETRPFYARDGNPYCQFDFFEKFAPRCAYCTEIISGQCINVAGKQWCVHHFRCHFESCKATFEDHFYLFEGKPYCELHYHHKNGTICRGCNNPISGKCVNVLGSKWHVEHFCCSVCKKQFTASFVHDGNNRLFCQECHQSTQTTHVSDS